MWKSLRTKQNSWWFGDNCWVRQCFLGSFIEDHMKVYRSSWSRRCRSGCIVLRSWLRPQNHNPRQHKWHSPKSLQFEWAYLQRVVPNCADALKLYHCGTPLTRNSCRQCLEKASPSRRRPCFPCLHAREDWECETQLSQHSFHTPYQ